MAAPQIPNLLSLGSSPRRPAKLVYLYDAMSEQLGRSLQNFLDWCNSNWRFHTISCGCSSVGRAPRCQRDCRRFDSDHPLQIRLDPLQHSCTVELSF